MKILLLSGGSGNRLWPLSNNTRSKQFLKVLRGPNNQMESMVQRVWRQLEESKLKDCAFISAGISHLDVIHSQLGNDFNLILEPEQRDTFPAILLASSYMYSKIKLSLDEVICVLPVDPFVDSSFFDRIKEMEEILCTSKSEIALLGVKPTYPSAKYGYIIPVESKDEYRYSQVEAFKEKPKESEARQMLDRNALWNCGVFAFKLRYIISLMIRVGLPIEYDHLVKNYTILPKMSFDYEVIEKEPKIVVLKYEGAWKDLGTWNTLTEEIQANMVGNGIISRDCENTHLINELNIPVTVLGIHNALIAASPDGILVTDKKESPRLKELTGDLFHRRPMFEERRWGWYRVIEYWRSDDGKEVLVKRLCVKSGQNLSYQLHKNRNEVWTITSGEGEFVLEGKLFHVKAGDVLQIPVGTKHAVKAISDLEFIEVQTGSPLIEEDIVRICLTWDEVKEVLE